MAIFTLIEALDEAECCRSFIDLCVFMRACARRWHVCKCIMRLIQISAHEKGVKLPVETRALFEEFEANPWRPVHADKFSSAYLYFTALF